MEEEHECDCPPEGAPAWMATFSDMATLMLCFFVLLLSFANMDVENFRTALGSVKEAFGVQHKVQGRFEALSDSPISLSNDQSTDVLYNKKMIEKQTVEIVRQFLAKRGLSDQLEVASSSRGVIVRTKDQVLFDSGEAILKVNGHNLLEAIRVLAGSFDGQLAVEGHTDDTPIQSPVYPSNWELSGARSAAVLRYLLETGVDPGLVHVAGYADMRPVARNDTPAGRARNRRVEFVFEYDAAAYTNPSDVFRLPEFKETIREKTKEAKALESEAEALLRKAREAQAQAEEAQRKAAEAQEEADRTKRKLERIRDR